MAVLGKLLNNPALYINLLMIIAAGIMQHEGVLSAYFDKDTVALLMAAANLFYHRNHEKV